MLILWEHTSSLEITWNGVNKILTGLQYCKWKCLVYVRGWRRMLRLVKADRKFTVNQMITFSFTTEVSQKNNSVQCVKPWMDYTSRRPHQVQVLSAIYENLSIQYDNWTVEDCKKD